MKERINIVCAADDKYVPYYGVMITSIFENHKEHDVYVYIMIDKPLQDKNVKLFSKLEKQYGQQIHYCMVDKSFFENSTQIGIASCRKECRSRWSPYH